MAHIEVPHPGASEIVGRLLSEALSEHPDVQWLGLVSEDGFAIASDGQATVDDDAVAAGAVRMMIQVRAMAKALGQTGTSQMFMEGSDNGICVIDKDPWVLVMVGAPGVPIGLLRYEAREIAEAFPGSRRAALSATPVDTDEAADDHPQWWSTPAADPDTGSSDDEPQSEIRWADEPVGDDASGVGQDTEATDFVIVDPDEITTVAAPALQEQDEVVSFDTASVLEEEAVAFDLSAGVADPDEVSFDLAPPVAQADEVSFDLAPPVTQADEVSFDLEPPAMAAGFAMDDLGDLAPPSGPSIDLPPPVGPAFALPPPV